MRLVSITLVLLATSAALAQGGLAGTFHAPEVGGYVVIACYPSPSEGCDWSRSGTAQLSGTGSNAAFAFPALPAGDYLLIAWLDVNGDGLVDEAEISLFGGPDGEPVLVTAPAQGIEFRLAGAIPDPSARPDVAAQPGTRALPDAAAATDPALRPLVGIWQQTRSFISDWTSSRTGYDFSSLTGYSAELVVFQDASYTMSFYSSGRGPTCSLAYYLERSEGRLQVQGRQLVLMPTRHTVQTFDCTTTRSEDQGTTPFALDYSYSESVDARGFDSYHLGLEGGLHPLSMELLHRAPRTPARQPAQPEDFVLGSDPMFREFLGTWAPQPESDIDFYDPATGAFYFPAYNTAHHQWIRFDGSGYELAKPWESVNYEVGCSKDVVYYEKGRSLFAITDASEGDIVRGHLRLQATEARLIVQIRGCKAFDQVLRYDLTPPISYFGWEYRLPGPYGERLTLVCGWEPSAWQAMVCGGWVAMTFSRR